MERSITRLLASLAVLTLLATLTLRAQITGTLAGRVAGPDGRPLQGCTIRLLGTTRGAVSKADGSFLVAGIRAGEYDVEARYIGYENQRQKTRISVNQTTTLNIYFYGGFNSLNLSYRTNDPHIGVPYSGTVLPGVGIPVRVYRIIDPVNFLLSNRQILMAGLNRGAIYGEGRLIDLANKERFRLVKEWRYKPAMLLANNTVNEMIPLGIDRGGVYIVEVAYNPERTMTLLATVVISDLAIITKQGSDGALVYVSDARTGRRQADVELTYGYDSASARSVVTHFDGTARISLPPCAQANAAPIVLGEKNGQIALAGLECRTFADPSVQLHLQTDRPIYRPGQMVLFRGIVRQPDGEGGYHELPRDMQASVMVFDGQGKSVMNESYPLSDLGTFSGDLCLGAECPLGRYEVAVSAGESAWRQTFEVAEYKKPEYEVKVTPGRIAYLKGETIDAVIEGRYLFGAPVAGGEVEYAIVRTPLATAAASNYTARGGEEMIHTTKGRLGADGKLAVSYPIEASIQSDYIYRIQALVADPSRRAIAGHAEMRVARDEYTVALKPEKNFYRVGDEARVTLAVSRFDGRPAGSMRYLMGPSRRFLLTAPPLNEERIEYGQSSEGFTDSDGRATIVYPVKNGGMINLRVDLAEHPTAYSILSFASVNQKSAFCDIPGPAAQIIPERSSYRTGEELSALVILRDRSVDLLVTAEGRRIIGHDVKRIDGWSAIVHARITKAHAPNFDLAIATVAGGNSYSQKVPVNVIAPERTMTLEIAGDRKSFRPGDSATLKVRAVDGDGSPVRNTEIALAAVDEAIFSLAPDNTSPLSMLRSGRVGDVTTSATPVTSFPMLLETRSDKVVTVKSFSSRLDLERVTINNELTTSINGFTIRGGRDPQSIRVEGIELGDPFAGGFGSVDTSAGEAASLMASAGSITPGFMEPRLRATFKDLMAWSPALRTDADGYATLGVRFPDNITSWRVTARGVSEELYGDGTATLVARKDLFVRMETPPFVTQGDSLLVATTVHNYLPTAKRVTVRLSGENASIALGERTITIPADSDGKIDWPVTVAGVDTVRLRVKALTDEESDAMETSLPVTPRGLHGAASTTVAVAVDADRGELTLVIPSESSPETRAISLAIAPSLGSSMIGALDDLIGYPYGCAEQTMSRFLPTVVVARTLKELHLPFNPKLEGEIPEMVAAGVTRLSGFQHADGGWGWWENDATNPFMTAYIIYGLSAARQAGYQVPVDRLQRGAATLHRLIEQGMPESAAKVDDPATLAYMLFASGYAGLERDAHFVTARIAALAKVLGDDPYSRALLALAARYHGDTLLADELTDSVATSLAALMKEDGTRSAGDHVGRWQGDPVEAAAYALRALVAADAHEDLAERGAEWLVAQRQGTSWGSTRQTAMAIYAISDYVRRTNEDALDFDLVVKVNGEPIYDGHVGKREVMGEGVRLEVRGEKLRAGENRIVVERSGRTRLHVAARADYYTDGAAVRASDAGFRVEREYYTLRRELKDGRYIYLKEPLRGSVRSGDEIFVKVRVANDAPREYFLLEDPLPAGCEVVTDVTGYAIDGEREYPALGARRDNNWHWWYSSRDLRDEKIAFFASRLERGSHEFSYILRAQIPGSYNVMPTLGMLNYFPEINGNSEPQRLMILE